jgi:protein arginine N-methyltransferase 1
MADSFGEPAVQERLLVDRERCERFREAIRRAVRPGDVVVDVGAGTGLLSFFAASEAGAKRVYAIEMSRVAEVASRLIEANGLEERVELIWGNSRKVTLPERCDVLISETLSTFCFDTEDIIGTMADARKRFLKPGGRMIPESCKTFLVPFTSDQCGLGRLPSRFYGFDYQAFRQARFAAPHLLRASGKDFTTLADVAVCHEIDFRRDNEAPAETMIPFSVSKPGRLDGFLGWFEAELGDAVKISNSPWLPLTAWWQIYFPVIEQPTVNPGDRILLRLDPNMAAGGADWIYSVKLSQPNT